MTAISAAEGPYIPWWLVLLEGLAALILGILLLLKPGMTLVVLVQVVGFFFFVDGVFNLVSIFFDRSTWVWKFILGILGILAGIVVIEHPLWSAVLVPTTLVILLGTYGIVTGAVSVYQALRGAGWGVGAMGAVVCLFGLVLLARPLMGTAALPWVLGVLGIGGGVAAIISALRMRKNLVI